MVWNAFLLAIREIRRNVLRSFLTILGIVIGVAAVITLVTIGSGVTLKVKEDLSKLGSNLLLVRIGQFRGPSAGPSEAKHFDDEDVEAIRRDIDSVAAVAPTAGASITAIYGNKSWSTSVTGTDNQYFDIKDWTPTTGRTFTDGELRAGKAVCIIGETVRKEIFGTEDPVGQAIRLQNISCQVIGLLSPKGTTGMGNDQDDTIIMPLHAVQRRMSGNRNIRMIMASAVSENMTAKAKADIEDLLRERRRISQGEDDDFQVMDMTEIADTMQSTTKILTMLLGAVAAVSLLVGGIGIMNIMLVSVTERTREIGTRLAIGAMERDVMIQFLVEAIVLSSMGGLVGIVLALAGSSLLTRVLSVPFIFNLGINMLAFAFSGAVGVIFGFFPARRAARLDPIDALRYE